MAPSPPDCLAPQWNPFLISCSLKYHKTIYNDAHFLLPADNNLSEKTTA